jgi:hypothetical protein
VVQAANKRKVTATGSVNTTGSAAPAAAAAASSAAATVATSSNTTKSIDVQLVRHRSMICAGSALVALVELRTVNQAAGSQLLSCEVAWRDVGVQKSMPTSQLKLVFDIINS